MAIAASPRMASSLTLPPSKMKVTSVAELVIQPGQGGLAGGQGVALDLHVDEELGHDPDHRGPQEDEPDLGGDVGPEDELARGQPDPGRDHARPEDLAQGQGIGHVPVGDRRQVPGGEGGRHRPGLWGPAGPAVDLTGHAATTRRPQPSRPGSRTPPTPPYSPAWPLGMVSRSART